ncbi:MAG TPA: 2Fe-2S iron-sulfur cluster-binding protein [Thermoanaerobaculia bacterium]|nr:2Fe-2S iron-sulfur cluster-binding protein [Thermoanaerobaculia bacterium]HUM31255.1 2Fe-2S iron-sulfur cluster-binding protein [Thermoanaerobaculia bacterium]HXK69618.1 2Fe-2S iron-sulfur cluster-binding protein [Thermoanaerobaculia bacterium]
MAPRVRFRSDKQEGEIPEGSTLLDAALQLGVILSHVCGGIGSCGTCRVRILNGQENLSEKVEEEEARDLAPDVRLACQSHLHGDVEADVVTVQPAAGIISEW